MSKIIQDRTKIPERIHGWINTQMSVARYSGGVSYMGHSYYVAPNEPGAPLVREDVIKREAKQKKEERMAAKQYKALNAAKAQGELL